MRGPPYAFGDFPSIQLALLSRVLYDAAMRLIIFLLIFLGQHASALDLSHLDRKARERLFNGEFVMLTHEVAGASWPRLEILKLVDSDVLSFGAFFADFEAQTTYIKDLIKAKNLPGTNPLDVHVDYEMRLPWPLSNAVYTHGHRLSWNEPNSLKVEWYIVKSSVAEEVTGSAEFINFNNKTLWHYQTFVRPKSVLAGFFSGSMQKDTLNSAKATVEAFESLRKNNPKQISEAVKKWRDRFKISTK